MKQHILLTIALLLSITTFGCKQTPDPQPAADDPAANDTTANPFLGLWAVEYDRTLEASKASPKYKPEDAEKMPRIIKTMMEMMKMEITETEMIFHRGDDKQAAGYTVKSKTDTTLTTMITVGEAQAETTLTLIENKYMNMKTTGSDDTEYYIWQRAAPTSP